MSPSNAVTDTDAGVEQTRRRNGGRRLPEYMAIDRKFRINPMTVKAKDGSERKVILEHRFGASQGAYSKSDLMKSLGLEKEYFAMCKDIERKFRDPKLFRDITDRILAGRRQKLATWINKYKTSLEKFYRAQGIKPLISFVPHPGKTENVLYIQAFVDSETGMLVAGDVEDLVLWTEATAVWSRPIADKYKEALKTARAALKIPNVSRDIQARLGMVISGDITRAGLLEHVKGDQQ